jgi:RimJ/RimL family protein N-acetyltransferase
MEMKLARCLLRSWRGTDAPSIAPHADNRRVWINLRDAFPHPYRLADAQAYIRAARAADPETSFAIVVEKAGYVCEGRMRRSAIKDGRVIDQLLYAHVVPDPGDARRVAGRVQE